MDQAVRRERRQTRMTTTTTAEGANTAITVTTDTTMTTENKRATAGGWVHRNDRYLPDSARGSSGEEGEDDGDKNGEGGGRSYVRGYAPAFESVMKRGGNDFVRGRKLDAEDVLLRDILLPPPPPSPSSLASSSLAARRSRSLTILYGSA